LGHAQLDVSEWLVREVLDLLDAGPVGLYEFLWCLASKSAPPHAKGERLEIARQALQVLRAGRSVELVDAVWCEDARQPFTGEVSAEAIWDEPRGDGSYVALTRR